MKPPPYDRTKRAFDVVVATLLFVVTLPIQAVTAMLIRLRLGRPVLFKQTRPGLHAEPFEIVKFRTMLDPDPAEGLLDDAERMTATTRWLRAASLDELPTLWNIIRGDMSLVGPRPLLMQYLPLYSALQARRHEVRPGVTGLAQVSGRNSLSWEEKFRLDIRYVDHHTFVGDLRILLSTLVSVATRDGISATGHATMPPFLGNKTTAEHQ